MGRIRGFAAGHRLAVGAGAFFAVGLLVFAILWFEPQKLIQEKTVDEADPTPAVTTPGGTSPASVVVAAGAWRSLEHKTTGSIRILRLANGSNLLRFVDLDTSNGPDLRVYLSEKPHTLGWHDYGDDYLELGELKGNRGNQNYAIPAGTDIARYKSVVIWCVRFKVGFAVAPVQTST